MADNEMAEIHQRATAAVAAAIQAAGQLAQVLIDARIAQLQRAARNSEDQARQIRARVRAAQQADAAIWRPATSPSWWRHASADDIALAWRASAGWAAVDPRASEAQRVMAERLAERGLRVEPAAGGRPGDATWLSDQLDRAALDDGDRTPDPRPDPEEAGERRRTAQQGQEEMAIYVREVWTADRAERVMGSAAWPALAYKLDQLKRAGHDVRDLLRQVPGFVDRAHIPAAYAFRVVDDYAADVCQAVAGEGAGVETQRAEERASVTLEGEWRETGSNASGADDAPARNARAGAGRASAGVAEHNVRAAQLATRAFPTSTKSAVADTTAAAPRVTGGQQRWARSAAPPVSTQIAGR
ncbi:hypothetical protein AB0873_16485 [Micromonospora sp. NPDC047707]|uniref:hypothetical protein n=1 Tax=Micromonospora sp. NPDC047707 TaxID=3154498 RepID=UPI0034567ECA